MIPMITSVNEVRQVKDMIKKICSDLDHNGISYDKNIQTGVMIETPAAAIMADAIAQEVDFFSIGTNDLTQYTIAVDRCNENVAYLYSAFNPAVLRLIRRIIECAHNAGIEAGMCGEAAANALMAPILLSFGLDEFSVSTGKVLETRKTIADWSLKEAGLVTDKVMSMATEKEVTDYLSDYLSERNKKIKGNIYMTVYETDEIIERVILVGVAFDTDDDTERSLDELGELAKTAGAQTVGRMIQTRDNFHPATYIGKGKIEELRLMIDELDATGIICDDELSPAQFKNLEDELGVKVMDRTMVILDIFAARATSSEGKIQVEMAQLKVPFNKTCGFWNINVKTWWRNRNKRSRREKD